MGTGESCAISLKKGQVPRYSNNILAGKWQIKSNCPRGLDMSRAEQIFVCTHIIQVLCITQRALHFISFQMFCSVLVSLCTDVHFSHTYHSQLCPLSCSQNLCNSPGMLPKSLSSVQVQSLGGYEIVLFVLLALSESSPEKEPMTQYSGPSLMTKPGI